MGERELGGQVRRAGEREARGGEQKGIDRLKEWGLMLEGKWRRRSDSRGREEGKMRYGEREGGGGDGVTKMKRGVK